MRLIFYLSISDMCVALFAQPIFTLHLVPHTFNTSCSFDVFAEFVSVFTIHLSEMLVVLIGLDRYYRLKCLNRYREIVNIWSVHVALFVVVLVAMMQGLIVALGTTFHVFHVINLVAVCADVALIIIIATIYMMTLNSVKKQRQDTINKNFVYNIERRVSAMTSRILLALVLLFTPYMVTAVMHHWLIDKSSGDMRANFNFALFISYELIFVNCSANAIIFLTLRTKGLVTKLSDFKSHAHDRIKLFRE